MAGTTDKTSSVSDAAREALDKGYAKAWIFDEDGDNVEGTFVGTTSGMTQNYGRQPIVIIEVDGIERSVWAMHRALQSQFLEAKPLAGDTIAIRRLPKKKSSTSANMYYPYRVVNLSAARTKTADWSLFGDDSHVPVGTLSAPVGPDEYEDDTPF